MRTAAALRPLRPARPACCHSEAKVPGQPAIKTASRPVMFTPEFERGGGGEPDQAARRSAPPPAGAGPRAGTPTGTRPPAPRFLRARPRPPGRQRPPGRHGDRLGAPPGPDEGQRLDVLPDQGGEQVGGLRRWPSAAAGRPPRRVPRPATVSGGSHSAKASGPRGDPSSVTSSASSPVSSLAQAAGEPMVAEASTNTGPDPAWCATTRRSRRSTCPTCEPKTPRYPWHSSMIT